MRSKRPVWPFCGAAGGYPREGPALGRCDTPQSCLYAGLEVQIVSLPELLRWLGLLGIGLYFLVIVFTIFRLNRFFGGAFPRTLADFHAFAASDSSRWSPFSSSGKRRCRVLMWSSFALWAIGCFGELVKRH